VYVHQSKLANDVFVNVAMKRFGDVSKLVIRADQKQLEETILKPFANHMAIYVCVLCARGR